MKTLRKTLAAVLAIAICGSMLTACGGNSAETTANTEATTAGTTTADGTTSAESTDAADNTASDNTTPLVIASEDFSQKFNAILAESVPDQNVGSLVNPSLMTNDRSGGIIYNAIEGETHSYNGTDYTYYGVADISVTQDKEANTTVYNIKIRDDIKFSDGETMDIDDVIFTYYTLADPTYSGGLTFNSMPVIGLKNYRANSSIVEGLTDEEIAAAYEVDEVKQNISDNIIRPVLESEYEWVGTLYGDDNYAAYTEAFPVQKDLFVAFYGLDEAYSTEGVEDSQVVEDIIAQYGADYATLGAAYAGDEAYFAGQAEEYAIAYLASQDSTASEVNSIAGINRINDYEVEVTTKGYDAAAIYQIAGINVMPLHYYGDESKYDYENNKFGFERGDLSILESKVSSPMGYGPYKFDRFENKIVYMEANENYYLGEPKIKYLQFKTTTQSESTSAVQTGAVDVSNPAASKEAYEEIRSYNSNGELTGDTISHFATDYLGYGYIGINANTIKVGEDASSEESKALRKALATILAVYRDLTVDSYFGDTATVINYPISNTSWAAPQKTDEGYAVAYSKGVDGADLYTSDMSADDKYAAALAATIEYFKAAGFTFDEAEGKFTAAPEGAKLEYELIIPGNGDGNHPSFALATAAKEQLASIGITLTITDPADSNQMWDKLNAGTAEMWCAAWSATIDPDMYQVYHSNNIVGNVGGTGSNYYGIADSKLDEDIMEARTSDDQEYRKAIYKECLDIIIDWAVEIPIYQRQDCTIVSTERVNMDTVVKDMTTYYGFMAEIEKLEMN
ncbi:MAG: ABC transporter substrate-binding protein [Ruminiclostridium sp.]